MANQQLQTDPHYQFLLKHTRQPSFYPQTQISFLNPSNPNHQPNLNLPIFNTDRCQWTPSFLLPVDKNFYSHNAMFLKLQFDQKIHRSLKPFTACQTFPDLTCLKLAYPDSKYCQVCKLSFEKYSDHTISKNHQHKVTKHKINKHIESLCSSFRKSHQNRTSQLNKKKITKIITRKASKKKDKNMECPTAYIQVTTGSQNGSIQTHQTY